MQPPYTDKTYKAGYEAGVKHTKPSEDTRVFMVKIDTKFKFIERAIEKIEKQMSNHIPTTICSIKKDLNAFKISQARIFTGILVSVVLMLIALVANLVV